MTSAGLGLCEWCVETGDVVIKLRRETSTPVGMGDGL